MARRRNSEATSAWRQVTWACDNTRANWTMTGPRLCSKTAEETVRLVGTGELTRCELVEAHLERIAALNGAINAIVETRGEAALAEAAAVGRDAANRTGH